MKYLELMGISKTYTDRRGRAVQVISDFSLDIKKGEFVCLVGPSGCGKTTVLRILAGLESMAGGRILLDGKDITRLPPEKRNMSVVFQHYALFPHMSVFNNVAFGLRVRRIPRSEIETRVEKLLGMVGLAGLGLRAPNELSGGQQQRVALARAIAVEPAILLCDEPLSNLDANLRTQMRSEIKNVHARLGLTTIYVTHDADEARFLADRTIEMKAL